MQLRRNVIAGAALALLSGAASADPASLIMLGASYMAHGAVASVALAWLAGGMIVSSALKRSEVRAANRAARAKAISELQARTVTALQADPAWRVVYGEATVGGDIHAIITHDKTNAKREDGSTYTRPDAYKSLVIVWADHQCKGVKTILINGIDIGAVDANGWVTGGAYTSSGVESRRAQFAAGTSTITLTEAIVSVLMCTEVINGAHVSASYTLSNGNKTLTLVSPNGAATARWLNYTVSKGTPRVRVEHYRGTSTQTASAYLIAQAPAQWTANHWLRGKCYSVITLDLEDSRFQGGWGDIMAVVEGHDQILDPRTSTTGYSQNTALCINNWLLSPWGYGNEVTSADIDQSRLIAAANACDVSTSYTEGATTITGPRYTCNGGFTTDQAKESVLEDLRESMAGHVPFDGQWLIDAGAWSTPVLAITDADLAGPIELVQAGSPSGELFNSIRTQYMPPQSKAVAEADPYVNTTLVTADGKSLWGGLALPFTNSKARCRQISRVVVERSRDGQILRIPLKRRALRLQVGDRFALTNTEYGLTAKTYRATDISVVPQGAQVVTAQEDAADVYDTADASSADPNPNTGLLSPLIVSAMGAITLTSGSGTELLRQDGTTAPRVLVSWSAVTDPYVVSGGFVEARWRNVDSLSWDSWVQAPGMETSVYLTGMSELVPVLVEARLRNAAGYVGSSQYSVIVPTSTGKSSTAGGNILINPSFLQLSTNGWAIGGAYLVTAEFTADDRWSGAYKLNGAEGAFLHVTSTTYAGTTAYADFSTTVLPVVAGRWYQAQALVQAHRAAVCMYIVYYNAAGTVIGYGLLPAADISSIPANGVRTDTWIDPGTTWTQAKLETDYARIWGNFQAPSGCTQALVAFRVFQKASLTDQYLFIARAMLAEGSTAMSTALAFDWGNGALRAWQQVTYTWSDDYDFAGVSIGTSLVTLRSFSFVPRVGCRLEITGEIVSYNANADAGNLLKWEMTGTDGSSYFLGDVANTTLAKQGASLVASLQATGDVTYTISIKARRVSAGAMNVYTSQLRIAGVIA